MGADRRDALAVRRAAHREQRRRDSWRAIVPAARSKHGARLQSRREAGRWELIVTPGSVAVKTHNLTSRRALGHARGVVKGWTPRSKRRCMLRAASIAWPAASYVFLTLTYPDAFPRDPKIWKRDLHEFAKAWARKHGPIYGLWVLEFQRRGAPHFHIVLVAPDMPLPQLRRWYARTWHRIVTRCEGDHDRARGLASTCVPWHYERHLADEHCKAATGARAAIAYVMRELGKESQKSLPEFLEDEGAGRWWGVWGFKPDERSIRLTRAEYVHVRRAVLRIGHVVAQRQHEHRERLRLWRLKNGKPWTRRPRPPRPSLSLHSINQGITVMDPDLRPYVFARAFGALVEQLRGAVARGSVDNLDLVTMQRVFGWR